MNYKENNNTSHKSEQNICNATAKVITVRYFYSVGKIHKSDIKIYSLDKTTHTQNKMSFFLISA